MKKNFTLFMLAFFLGASLVCAQTIRYVKPTGTATQDGSSWINASGDLQAMIDASILGDEVWVAAGTYLPTVQYPSTFNGNSTASDARFKTFKLKNGVSIYGGFDGTNNVQTIAGRNLNTDVTILSGNLQGITAITNDAYHVITAVGVTSQITIDGIVITRGNANNSSTVLAELDGYTFSMRQGAAITVRSSKLKLVNVTIKDNVGISYGGAVNVEGNATNGAELIFDKCWIENNRNINSGVRGGALYVVDYTTINIANTTFNNNNTPGGTNSYGGALSVSATTAVLSITNTSFTNNKASGRGGAIYLGSGTIQKLENLLFYNNTSIDGGAIYLDNNIITLVGSTFYKNTATNSAGAIYYNSGTARTSEIYNSLFIANDGGAGSDNLRAGTGTYDVYNSAFNGTGNGTDKGGVVTDVIETDVFKSITDTDADFLRLKETATNPAIDKGLNGAVTTAKDLAGNTRTIKATAIVTPTVDMGAYENQITTLPVTLINYTAKASGKTTVLNWATANETNNQYFILERSTGGKTFEKLTKVSSKGSQGNQYHYTDYAPFNGNNYYRLSQIDLDGTTKILGEQVVKHSLNVSLVTVYPNPAVNTATILFGDVNYTKLELISSFGTLLQSHDIAKTSSQASLDMSDYPKGIYYVRLVGGNNVEVKKIIK